MNMDIGAFAADIHELVEDFVKIRGTELSQIKELWKARNFTFIHEAKPSCIEQTFFMQAMYSCALGLLDTNLPWSKRLGGLYVLYILYETQLSKPLIKIYLSPDDLRNIDLLVKEAKYESTTNLCALRVVKRMMTNGFFLYGSVAVDRKKMHTTIDNLCSKNTELVQKAGRRIFAGSSAKQHFEGNLIKDLGLNELAILTEDYAASKQQMYTGGKADDQTIQCDGPILGDELKHNAQDWMQQRRRFYSTKEYGLRINAFGELELQEHNIDEKGFEGENEADELEMEIERTLDAY